MKSALLPASFHFFSFLFSLSIKDIQQSERFVPTIFSSSRRGGNALAAGAKSVRARKQNAFIGARDRKSPGNWLEFHIFASAPSAGITALPVTNLLEKRAVLIAGKGSEG